MKRFNILAVLTAILLSFPLTAQAAPVGTMTAVKGSVDIRGADGISRLAQMGEPVHEGDILRTKSKSRAEVTFSDGSLLRMAQNSRIQVRQYDMGGTRDRGILQLFRGKVQSIVKRAAGFFGNKRNRFEVHTPTAVAGVRGTNFFTWYTGGQSGSAVKEGIVYTYAANKPTEVREVRAGQSSIVFSADKGPVISTATGKDLSLGGDEEEVEPFAFVGGSEAEADPFVPEEPTELVTKSDTTEIIPDVPDPYVPDFELLLSGGFTGGTLIGDFDLDTLSLSGPYDSAAAANAMAAGGDLSDGGALEGYLGGVLGSWEGLFSSIYVDPDGGAGFIYGNLSGDVTNGQLTADGGVVKTAALGTVADPAAELELADLFHPALILGTPDADPMVEGLLTANIDTGADRWLGIYSVTSTDTGYASLAADALYGLANSGSYTGLTGNGTPTEIPYLMVGYVNILDDQMADGQIGHVSVNDTGNIFYIDPLYHGTYDMAYRGIYDAAGDMALAGSGMFILDPLDYSGFWGIPTGNEPPPFLYHNADGTQGLAAGGFGLMGLVASATGYDFYAAGDYFMTGAAGVSETDPFVFATALGGTDLTGSGDELSGYTAGVWQYTTNSYGLPGDMDGALAAMKVSRAGGLVTVERLSGDLRGEYVTQPFNYEESDGVFRVRGDLGVESLTVAEADLATIQGTLSGTGTGDLLAYLDTSSDQVIGIYTLGLGNSEVYAGDAKVSGTFDGADRGYFLADVTGSLDGGGLAGWLQTSEYMADLSGDVYGIATEGDGAWIAQSVGQVDNFTRFDLSTNWGGDAGTLYFNDDGAKVVAARESGILGFVATADGYDIYGVGEYGLDAGFGGSESGPFIWDTVVGTDPATATGDGIMGHTAGLWQDGTLDGAMVLFNNSFDDAGGTYTFERLSGGISGDYHTGVDFVGADNQAADGLWQVVGNLTADRLTVAEADLATIQGAFSGTANGDLLAYLDTTSDQVIGIYAFDLGDSGAYAGDAEVGGTFDGADRAYFLADVTGSLDGATLAGWLHTADYMMDLSGDVFGLATDGATAGDGTWIARSVGRVDNFTRFDLSTTWGGAGAVPGTLYFNNAGARDVAAHESGILGFVATADGYDVYGAGEYSLDAGFAGSEADPFVWDTAIGADPATATGADEGIMGYTAGLWQGDAMDGAMALFNNSFDDAGGTYTFERLSGGISGDYHTGVDFVGADNPAADGLWRVDGTLVADRLTVPEANLETHQGMLSHRVGGSLGAGAISGSGAGHLLAFQDTATGQGLGTFSLGVGNEGLTQTGIGPGYGGFYPNIYTNKAAGEQAMEAMVGGEVDSGSGPLVGDLGALIGYRGGGQGYFLTNATGTVNSDGSITGDLAGTLMTRTFMADMTGSLFGRSDAGEIAGDGTWIGQGVGTLDKVMPLTHMASFGSDIAQGTRRLSGSYYLTGEGTAYYEYYPEYYYSIDTAGQTGDVRVESRGVSYYYNDYTRTYYNADGTTRTETYTYTDDWSGTYEETQGTWDPASFDLASLTQTPGASGYWNWQDDVVTSASSGYMNGLIGGAASLWSGADVPVTAIGTFGSDGPASVWMDGIYSRNDFLQETDQAYTTYDGGAYEGFVGGTHDAGALDGRFLAIYVDPSGNAGYLSGPLSGSAYTGVGMFAMDGVLNRDFVSNPGITSAELDDYIAGDYWDTALSGTLGATGMVQAGGYDSAGGYGGGWGDFDTLAIAGQNWGIFSTEIYGEFTNPDGAATWTSRTGGQGTFGATNPVTSYEGEYDYTGGAYAYYDFEYNEDDSYGYVYAYSYDGPGGLPYYTITYNKDGSYSGYDNDAGTPINGFWNDPQDPRYLTDLSELNQAPAAYGQDFVLDYLNDGIDSNDDNGFWLADTASTWADGLIGADVSGRFITMTQMGTLTGELLGTYSGDTEGFWEAVSLGTWTGTPLSFASSFGYGGAGGYGGGPPATIFHARKSYNGSYTFDAGGSYYYNYYGDGSYAYVSDSGNGENYYIYYNSDGTYSGHDSVAGQPISGDWTDPQDPYYLADLSELATPPAGAGDWSYQYENIGTVDSGMLSGIMGGTDDIWTATDIGATVLGSFTPGYGGYGGASVWGTDIKSWDVLDETPTTLTGSGNGGAYAGFLSGTRLDDALDGMVTALYLDPDGNLGFLTGELDGAIYPTIGMFEMDGTLNRFEIVSGYGGSPEYFNPYVSYGLSHYGSYGGFDGDGAIMGYGGYGMTAAVDWYESGLGALEASGLPENPRVAGVWSGFQYGDYEYGGAFDTGTVWDYHTAGQWNYGSGDFQMVVDGSQWVDGKAEGKVAGAWVDMSDYITGVMGGTLKGTFDANQFTWEAATSGVMLDTETFLAMAGTEAGRTALQGMNVPGFEVGRADLTGSVVDAVNGDVAVNMWNTTFFAHDSAANAPSIWASGAVTGNNPSARSYVNVPVAGGGVSAQFYMQNYSAGGNWSASVNNGSGTVGGHSVGFQGRAAGQAAGGTDPFNANATIDFSGTASGVVANGALQQ
jgi:FecR protein